MNMEAMEAGWRSWHSKKGAGGAPEVLGEAAFASLTSTSLPWQGRSLAPGDPGSETIRPAG